MMLLKLVQQLDCTSYNTSIMAIAFVFIKLQYCLLNNNNVLVDTKFANAK